MSFASLSPLLSRLHHCTSGDRFCNLQRPKARGARHLETFASLLETAKNIIIPILDNGTVSCSPRGHMGNWWHRGACIQSPGPSPLLQQQPPRLPAIPLHGLFLPIYCLGLSLSFPTDLSLLLRCHLSCYQSSLFQLGLQDRDFKGPLLGQTAILQSQAARKWLGEERKPWT